VNVTSVEKQFISFGTTEMQATQSMEALQGGHRREAISGKAMMQAALLLPRSTGTQLRAGNKPPSHPELK
jgi:hypothetical protein